MTARPVTPKRWKTLVAAGTAAGLAQTAPLAAAVNTVDSFALTSPWVVHVSGEAGEGGEGGESGAIENASSDAAYLTRLTLVEGHLIAATVMYARGMRDEAVGLAGHPEAEMMDEVRASLEARGAQDFTAALETVGEVMGSEADQEQVDAALSDLHDAISVAAEAANIPLRAQFETILALTRVAANEYGGVIEGGEIDDIFGYHEAYGFLIAARSLATQLSVSQDTAFATAAAKTMTALEAAIAQFGDMKNPQLVIGDASVLYGAAAQVELAGLQVK